jgi:hypothetical protein
MSEMQPRPPSNELDLELLKRAEEFAAQDSMFLALAAVCRDGETWREAIADTDAVLRRFGVEIPDDLIVRPLTWPGAGKPAPDFDLFVIRLTRCRTVWVLDREAHTYRQETICLGFEIIPRHIPPIA